MTEIDTNKIIEMAKKVDATGVKMEYHPSIRALVKLLARKAAEEHYEELSRVIANTSEAAPNE